MTHRILIVNVASHGLVLPTLAVVSELVRRGHEVSYATSAEFAEPVAAAGAQVRRYESHIASVNPAEVFAEDGDGARPHMLYLAENIAVLRATEAHYADTEPPDLVMYDDFPFIAGQLLAAKWGRPAARLSAAFASNERYSFAQEMIDAAGTVEPLALPRFRAAMADLLAEYGVPASVEECWRRIEDFNLVFVPKAFQFESESFDDRFAFVGPCFGNRTFLGAWQPPANGRPVVLVSLGATFNDHPGFFRDCAKAFADGPWHVVMTVGDRIDLDGLGPLPPNVEAHRWVSHVAVLEHAEVCVTHGGMGTVMESLYWGRPIVAVPHSFDVLPMARRVAELGLGEMLRPDELDGQRLRAAVDRLAGGSRVRRRVREMQRHVHEAGGPSRAADEIEAYLKERS